MGVFKLLWLFLHFLERGGVSELGLAQIEDSFQLSLTTKLKTNKRTVTSRVDCLLETVFQSHVPTSGGECSGRREKTLTWVVCDKGLRDALLRGPKTLYCATESHRTVSSGRFLGSPEARSEWIMPRVAPTLERRQLCNALFSLIVVLNRMFLIAGRDLEAGLHQGQGRGVEGAYRRRAHSVATRGLRVPWRLISCARARSAW
jgi:hypothetical protein